jgi:hypothetical protein
VFDPLCKGCFANWRSDARIDRLSQAEAENVHLTLTCTIHLFRCGQQVWALDRHLPVGLFSFFIGFGGVRQCNGVKGWRNAV